MGAREIFQGITSGQTSHEEVVRVLERLPGDRESETRAVYGPPTQSPIRSNLPARRLSKRRLLPTIGDVISGINAVDKDSLGKIIAVLEQNLQNRAAEHYFQRQYVEEYARHAVGLPVYGIIGLLDGLIESAGYGISELAEDVTFTAVRTTRKAVDGARRGWES